MKFEFDKKLLKYGTYLTFTAIAMYIAFLFLFNIGSILQTIFNTVVALIDLIKPLLIGIVITYLMFPITKSIEYILENNKIYIIKKQSNRRILGIVFSYLLITGIILALLCGIYFMIGGQLSKNTSITNIIDYIITYLSSYSFSAKSINDTLDNLNIPFLHTLKPYIIDMINSVQVYITSNLGNLGSYLMSIGSGLASFLIGLVISIYILKDSEYFVNLWHKLYHLIFRNSKLGNNINYFFNTIHEVFGKFIRGQLLEAFFVGVLSAIALLFIGIDYALIIGIIAGLCNMIPYVGPLVGTVLAAIMGLLSGEPIKILYAVIAMVVVQQIDNNLLAPKIVGDRVGLHAVFIMLAILIGGNVGGLLGMLLAVPLAASLKVLFNNWYLKHTEKENKNIK